MSVATLVASGYGVRVGLWDFRVGFQIIRWSLYTGLATAGLALIMLSIGRLRSGGVGRLVVALVLGAVVAFFPWYWTRMARDKPPINDITTDMENPPQFVAAIPRRAGSPVTTTYPGSETATSQQRAYPDLRPLMLPVPPAAAFDRALAAAKGSGWEIVASDAASGRIEATATTPWFGFHDDIVVRVAAAPSGSRVDVRSLSRVGRGDRGVNAARIRDYLAKVAGA